jgi:rod shape-determining protein MreD
MRWPLAAILAFVLTLIQTTLFDARFLGFQIAGVPVRPDLLLLLTLFVALVAAPAEAFLAALCFGLVEDLLPLTAGQTQVPLGIAALLFGLAAYVANFIRVALPSDRVAVQVLLALAFVFVVRVPQQELIFRLSDNPAGLGQALARGLGDAAYSAALAPWVFWILKKLAYRGQSLER